MKGVNITTIKVAHEDNRRKLSLIINGDFIAREVKLIKVKQLSILGNHYHYCSELFYVLEGTATYTLKSVKTGEIQVVELNKGNRLRIAPEIAHRVEMDKGTVTIEAMDKLYEDPEVYDDF